MEFIIITGMSGAGKSQAVDALEDIGFYCVDNVPPSMLVKFAELVGHSQGAITKIALVVDVRSQGMFSDFLGCIEDLRAAGYPFQIMFLNCDDKVLSNRYKETRRRHPLQTEEWVALSEAIKRERELLEPALKKSHYTIDSSMLSALQLKDRIRQLFSDGMEPGMVITCMSFGFQFGIPSDSDLVFDVRCLPNPFYVEELKNLAGIDEPVRAFVMDHRESRNLADKLLGLLDYLIPLYIKEGKSQLVISTGCTGGKHRSVVFAELIAAHFGAKGLPINISHRDITRKK